MRGISEEKLLRIVGSLYESAYQTDTEPWIDNYREIAALLGSGPGHVSLFDTNKKRFHVFGGTTPDEAFTEYFDYYQHISPFRDQIARLKPGQRFNRREHLDDRAFRRLELFNDFYSPYDIFHLEYRVFLDYDDLNSGIAFSRPPGKPDFSRRELAVIDYLLPHLARAFKLQSSFLEVQRQNCVISDAFDRIPQSVIVVDRNRKVIFSNACGKEILTGGQGLYLDPRGCLRTASRNIEFDRVLAGIFGSIVSESNKHAGVAAIERPDPLNSLELLIARFCNDDICGSKQGPLAIIYVTDPDSKVCDVRAMMVRIYGLTPTESRLAQALADGRSVAEACEDMSISINTGRAHLKRIFAKTGTDRQAALVKLILNIVANFRQLTEIRKR